MAKKLRKSTDKPTAQSPSPSKSRKYVYFFGSGKADGNRNMKDLLGGKGSGLAEMTNAGLPVPPGFTISTEVCNIYYQEKAKIPAAIDREIAEHVEEAREGRRRDARLDREPAAGLGPLGREVLDARHDGHDSQPRPERRCGRGAEGADAERPLRVRQLPPLHPDVRQRRARDSEGGVRARVRRRSRRRAARSSTPTSTRRRCARWSSATRRSCKKRSRASDFPQDPREQLKMARDAVFRSWMNPRAHRVPPHLRHPRPHRHGRQRADDGVRQHRRSLRHRRRLHPQPGHRREGVLRRVPDQRAGRGRRRPASARRSRFASSSR